MLVHLRLNVPSDLVAAVGDALDDPRVVHLVHHQGVSLEPPGDVYEFDVAREAADDVIQVLDDCGMGERGAITVEAIEGSLSPDATRAEKAAIGAGDDGVIWPLVASQAEDQADGSYSYYLFLILGCALAAIAVITDSPVLVVGAMVVSPDFAPISAASVGVVLRRGSLVRRALLLMASSFGLAIAVVTVLALIARLTGLIELSDLTDPRPLTGFIWHPDRWSFIVALLAGIAGTLSLTAGKSQAMVGVFISVTTVPAAGNLALGLAFWEPAELRGAGLQLVINIAGMIISGILTLLIQRLVWDQLLPRRRRRRQRAAAD